MSLTEIIAADRRLAILRALEEDPDYAHNEMVLRVALGTLGHSVSHDRLRADLAWLEEQQLVTIDGVADLQVARLTARGEDAALGRARVPGVRRPGPGE